MRRVEAVRGAIVITLHPTQLSSRELAVIKDGFHKATHAGDPVRVKANGKWHTMWFKYDNIVL